MIEVIIPVGPGHEAHVQRAITSVKLAADCGSRHEVIVTPALDLRGENGRSTTRNNAVLESKADWIFHLDADDMMHPDAFRNADGSLESDLYDAVWGGCMQLVDNFLMARYEIPQIDDYGMLIRYHPTWSVKIGHFVRPDVARKHPFNVDLDTGEDWDYYLRIWKAQRCVKIPSPFYIKIAGQHSTGPRSANGRQWSEAVEKMLKVARAGA